MGKPVKSSMAAQKGKSPAMKKGKGGKGGAAIVKGKANAQNGGKKEKRKKTPGEDVYEADEVEANVKDELRRFAGVEVYEYEQPEHFEDDEEIDDDEAFNSDDFEAYGDVGRTKKSKASRYEEEEEEDEDENGDDGEKDDLEGIFDESGDEGGDDKLEEDEEEEADEDEDEEDPEQHARLLSAVRGRGGEEEDGSFHVPAAAEGEFAVGSTAGSLSLQSLVGALQRNNNKLVQKGVTKELSKLAAKGAVLVPAAPVVTARAMREAGYEEASKAVSAWQPLVKQNRQKEQLKFPLNDPGRLQVTQASLVSSFQPRSKFEAEISNLIKQAGADEETLKKTEELELRKLSVSEVKERQAELSRMRSLLFHAEVKARRVNKIKSKKFHKVARKYKEKGQGAVGDEDLAELDEEAYKEKAEKRLRERAEERMSLKHKNTSKWVKHMLGRAYGDDHDAETRQAVVEQVKLGEELRKKMKEANSSGAPRHSNRNRCR